MRLALHQADLGYRGAAPVLSGVELAVAGGDYLVIAGANGSGKSTLMRSLLGALPLLAGRREVAPDLRLGYVPQQMALDADFPASVTDVVRMGLWSPQGHLTAGSDGERIHAALESVAMVDHHARRFGRLSGGQKQRVLLARALVQEPQLFLLDEPVSGVDARATEIILGILAEQVQAGAAVVLVSHQPVALRDQATRSILVKHGIVQELPVHELCSAEGMMQLWA